MRSSVLVTAALAVLGARAHEPFTYSFSPGSPTRQPNDKDLMSAKLYHTFYYPTCRDALEQCIQLWQDDWRYKDMIREEATWHCEVQFADMKGLCPHPLNHEVSEYLDPLPGCIKAVEECVGKKPDFRDERRTKCQTDLEKDGTCARAAPNKRQETPWYFPNCDSALKSCVTDKDDPNYTGRLQCLKETRAQGTCPYPIFRIERDARTSPTNAPAPAPAPSLPSLDTALANSSTVAIHQSPTTVQSILVTLNPTKTTLEKRSGTSDSPSNKPSQPPWDYTQCIPYFFECMRIDDGETSNINLPKRDLCCIEMVEKHLCQPGYCPAQGG